MRYYMYNLIIEDGSATTIRSIIERYYGKWMHVSRSPSKYSYNITLRLCREEHVKAVDVNTVSICLPEKYTPRTLVRMIEYARAYLRLFISWDKTAYRLDSYGEPLEEYSMHPAYDLFIWDKQVWLLKQLGLEPVGPLLINKRFGGLHYVYSGKNVVAELVVPDEGILIYLKKRKPVSTTTVSIHDIIEKNKPIITKHVAISRRFLESLGNPDIVIVSFSGGKDSLVTLDLAIKHYGKKHVRAIYIDTGVDFPITRKYISRIAEYYGISIDTIYAPVKDNIPRYGLPTRKNRWCTLLKVAAFRKKLEEYRGKYRKILVIVGDRDTESEKRSRKPPVRRRRGYLEAAPIKQWATIHVQLYTMINNLPVNPLYEYGFYRLGCYICPALTSLEKYVMVNRMLNEIKNLPWFKEYIERETS